MTTAAAATRSSIRPASASAGSFLAAAANTCPAWSARRAPSSSPTAASSTPIVTSAVAWP
eukprot:CAMPEP_0181366262 /NCGR_PEP_ID=MMETSP1106-20121128/10585_1 /TAXON_ID=81844 /ORGANISM="Mantoniella antarctica, Strain SL-175" /LENGTH=59 /DNA_ID=CAMNT_0023481549 /DNA_START=186 /DNA_END=365 /DNA_ORIENTATION=-